MMVAGEKGLTDQVSHIIDELCKRYRDIEKFAAATRKDLFQVRDFAYFLRYLSTHGTRDGRFELSPTLLLRGLQRNFGGIKHSDFNLLVLDFFQKVGTRVSPSMQLHWANPAALPEYEDTFVEHITAR